MVSLAAFRAVLVVFALALGACATTTIRNAWFDPAYNGSPLRKVVVAGIHGTLADRRVFEDVFAQQRRSAAVDAVPGYQLLPDEAKSDEPRWNAAVRGSGADAVLMVRLVRMDTRTSVSTALVPAPCFGRWGAYGWYPGWVGQPVVQQYDVAIVETNLFAVRTQRVVWAATSETLSAGDIPRETIAFARVMIDELTRRGLIAPRAGRLPLITAGQTSRAATNATRARANR